MDLEQKIIYQQNMLMELEDQLFRQRQLQEEVDVKINQLHYEVEATRAAISNM